MNDRLIQRLQDMADFCDGVVHVNHRPHPNNVARLCRDAIAEIKKAAK